MCRHDFSAETERQRVFGSGRPGPLGQSGQRRAPRPRGQVEGRTLHHRRLFLVSLNPNEPWVKPENSPRMVAKADQDGAAIFDFEETAASSRDLKSLRQIVGQEDPQLLQQYLQRNSFSLDGLLVMAEFHRHQGSHEQAREFVRRAVYTLECSLSPDFSPFQTTGLGPFALRPRVRLDVKNEPSEWSGWSWLNALWRHMHCLRGLGMHRTSLEVCKLLLASRHLSSIPQNFEQVLLLLSMARGQFLLEAFRLSDSSKPPKLSLLGGLHLAEGPDARASVRRLLVLALPQLPAPRKLCHAPCLLWPGAITDTIRSRTELLFSKHSLFPCPLHAARAWPGQHPRSRSSQQSLFGSHSVWGG